MTWLNLRPEDNNSSDGRQGDMPYCTKNHGWSYRVFENGVSASSIPSHVMVADRWMNTMCTTPLQYQAHGTAWTSNGWVPHMRQAVTWSQFHDDIYIYISNGLCLSTLPQRVLNTHMREWLLYDLSLDFFQQLYIYIYMRHPATVSKKG